MVNIHNNSSPASMDSETAKKRFEVENNIQEMEGDEDYKFDEDEYNDSIAHRPWRNE